ncbi:MAG: LruC domain-containing protein [Cyclobacteriaceae bacterium]
MKQLIKLYTFLLLLISFQAFSNNTLKNDAELGDRDIYFAGCWGMEEVTVSDERWTLISGDYSFRTNEVTNDSNTATWLKTPWMVMEAGKISFTTRLDGRGGGKRGILIQYISFDSENEATGEGDMVKFDSFDFPNPINRQTKVHEVSVTVPKEIIGQTVKIIFSFVGKGGDARIGMDEIEIPGNYSADPSAKCFPVQKIKDRDADGMADDEENYPDDPFRAFDNYFPSEEYGTLMFEDLWPAIGDYDFNDLVMDYRINRVTDAEGEIVEIVIELLTRAAGAGYQNGFGISFTGLDPDRVLGVEGTKIKSGSIHHFMENGLEAGPKYATVIPFDHVHNVLTHPGGGSLGINTDPKAPIQDPSLQKIIVTLKREGKAADGGVTYLEEVGMHNFNPFLISNQQRGMEIHLPGKEPTALADPSIFGTKNDGSLVGEQNYYRSIENGMPWGLNVTKSIPYMINKVGYHKGYLKFYDWVVSGGKSFEDWYLDLPGYRNGQVLLNAK